MEEKYFPGVNFLKNCRWWEKSVEYHFVQLLTKNLLLKKIDDNKKTNEDVFVNCAPLAGVEEQFIGDALFNTLNTYYIIEFKKESKSTGSEVLKYITTKKEYVGRFNEELKIKEVDIKLKFDNKKSKLTDEEADKKIIELDEKCANEIKICGCETRYEIAKETLLKSHEKFIKNHVFIYGDTKKLKDKERKFLLKTKDYWGHYAEDELNLSTHLKNNMSYKDFLAYVKDLIQWRGFIPGSPGGPGKEIKFDNLIIFAIDGLGNPTIIKFEEILKCITGDDSHYFFKSYESRLNKGNADEAANDKIFGLTG